MVCGIGPPPQPIHTGCRIAFERKERRPEQIDGDVVGERGELRLLLLPCGKPYTVERP
jgi:hypothetical protein